MSCLDQETSWKKTCWHIRCRPIYLRSRVHFYIFGRFIYTHVNILVYRHGCVFWSMLIGVKTNYERFNHKVSNPAQFLKQTKMMSRSLTKFDTFAIIQSNVIKEARSANLTPFNPLK